MTKPPIDQAPHNDPPMTAEEYRQHLGRLGITQAHASHLLGVSDRTGQRYATDQAPIPQLVARVLRITEDHPRLLTWLEQLAGP